MDFFTVFSGSTANTGRLLARGSRAYYPHTTLIGEHWRGFKELYRENFVTYVVSFVTQPFAFWDFDSSTNFTIFSGSPFFPSNIRPFGPTLIRNYMKTNKKKHPWKVARWPMKTSATSFRVYIIETPPNFFALGGVQYPAPQKGDFWSLGNSRCRLIERMPEFQHRYLLVTWTYGIECTVPNLERLGVIGQSKQIRSLSGGWYWPWNTFFGL